MGVPENEARQYENAVRQGKTLVTFRADNDGLAERVVSILDSCGASDIEGDVNCGPVVSAAVFGGEPDTPAADLREREVLSHDEADEPDYRRAPRTANWNRDTDVRHADLRANTDLGADDLRNTESATIPVKETN